MDSFFRKYGKDQGIVALFGNLVDSSDEKATPLLRGAALLDRARDLTGDMLDAAWAKLPTSASAVRVKYRSLYREAEMNREKEEGLRLCKTRELVLLLLLKLEQLSRAKNDPVDAKQRAELVALFEETSVLLVNPSIDPWLDLVDFCEERFGKTLPRSLALLFDELEVVPFSRRRPESEEVQAAGEEETAFVRDKKRIKTELATQADAKLQDQEKPAASLGLLRKSEKKSKTVAPAPAPAGVVVKKVKVKRKISPKKKVVIEKK